MNIGILLIIPKHIIKNKKMFFFFSFYGKLLDFVFVRVLFISYKITIL